MLYNHLWDIGLVRGTSGDFNPNPTSPTSSNEVEDFFSTPTPVLTPSPTPSVMEDNRDTPPHQPGANPPAAEPALPQAMTALAQAMTALMAQLQNAPAARPRARSPDPAYDHAPRARIKARDPDPYDEDQVKITYAVSWLKGTAQHFALYWDDFEEALKTTFGEPDPVASASYKLDHLVMKENHHINKYNVDFSELATITGYDNRALHAMCYRGLAPRIKDALAISGKPAHLERTQNQSSSPGLTLLGLWPFDTRVSNE